MPSFPDVNLGVSHQHCLYKPLRSLGKIQFIITDRNFIITIQKPASVLDMMRSKLDKSSTPQTKPGKE